MIMKRRSPDRRHVTRTRRDDVEWLFERISSDQSIHIQYVKISDQLADLMTKGSFSSQAWQSQLQRRQTECFAHSVVELSHIPIATGNSLRSIEEWDQYSSRFLESYWKLSSRSRTCPESNVRDVRQKKERTNGLLL